MIILVVLLYPITVFYCHLMHIRVQCTFIVIIGFLEADQSLSKTNFHAHANLKLIFIPKYLWRRCIAEYLHYL